MPKAPAGVRRMIDRLRPGQNTRSTSATRFHQRSVGVARTFVARAELAATPNRPVARSLSWAARVRGGVSVRLHSERAVPIGAAAILLVASVLSYAPAPTSGDNQGGPVALGSEPRLAVGGSDELQFEPVAAGDESYAPIEVAGLLGGREHTTPAGPGPQAEPVGQTEPEVDGAFLDDGTLLKPIAVDTSIADSSSMLERYKVQSGDTLVGIAGKFDVSMMTVWWANKLSSKDDLKVGQILVVPPVTGLMATVKEGDTLEGMAKTYGIDTADIVEINQLDDPTLVIGQTVILPGAAGAGIPTPKPTPKRVVSSSGTVRAPVTYSGGAFVWPVVGGNNYISQYFRYGHYGLDIAATYGSTVRAGAAGTVLYAGWRSNGGGYQVWIGHGSGLYTTYNHMAGVSVGTGQGVARGQQVGRVGSSGYATGSHLHFEVWTGPIWNGGSRVNPLRYF